MILLPFQCASGYHPPLRPRKCPRVGDDVVVVRSTVGRRQLHPIAEVMSLVPSTMTMLQRHFARLQLVRVLILVEGASWQNGAIRINELLWPFTAIWVSVACGCSHLRAGSKPDVKQTDPPNNKIACARWLWTRIPPKASHSQGAPAPTRRCRAA